MKYTKLHPQFIEKAYLSIEKSGQEVKLKVANDMMDSIAEDIELFSDPEEIAKQFQAVKSFAISDLVSDWIDEASMPRGIMTMPNLPTEHDEEEVPEIDPSFESKNEHYDEEDYLPEEEEMAVYNEEDTNSEEVFIGNDERILTEADLNGIELPNDEHAMRRSSPTLDDESTHNLIDEQPSLELDEELARTASLPNVEKVGLPGVEATIEDEASSTFAIKTDEVKVTIKVEEVAESEEEEEETPELTPEPEPTISSYPPLKGTIPLNLKFKFQKDLFNGDNTEFNNAIDMIDQCKDYHTAIALVKEKYIRPFDWDLGADATIDFLSMIDKKFE